MLSVKSRTLFPAAAIITASIAACCILTQVILTSSLKKMRSDARVMRMAENQRALSQEIVAEIAADNLDGILTGKPLDSLTNAFSTYHKILHDGDDRTLMPALNLAFINRYKILDSSFQEYLSYINEVVNVDNSSTAFIVLLKKQATYLRQLDVFIDAANGDAEKNISDFQSTELALMLVSLLIMGIEVILILIPSIRRLHRQSRQFKAIAFNQSHIVRQPLANIQGIINLLKMTPEQAEKDELLNYLYLETEKLNELIIETVQTAVQPA